MRDIELLIDPVGGTIVESVASGSKGIDELSLELGINKSRLKNVVRELESEGIVERELDGLEINHYQLEKLNQYLSKEIDASQRFIEDEFLSGSIDVDEYISMSNSEESISAEQLLENGENPDSTPEALENSVSRDSHELRAKQKAFDTTESLLNS